jgi:uncharacterized protein (TIGR00251 family)
MLMSNQTFLHSISEGTVLDIYVQPKASKNEIVGVHEGCIKIRLTAPPVEGEANKECVRFLAKLFGVPKSSIEIMQGHKARRKTLLFRGVSAETLLGRLDQILVS